MPMTSSFFAGTINMVSTPSLTRADLHQYPDFTIKLGDNVFQLHRSVLVAGKSKYFQAACKPKAFKEGITATLVLNTVDFDPSVFTQVIEFIYNGEYRAETSYTCKYCIKVEDPIDSQCHSLEALISDIKAFQMADYLIIPDLKNRTGRAIVSRISHLNLTKAHIDDFTEVLRLAYVYNLANIFKDMFWAKTIGAKNISFFWQAHRDGTSTKLAKLLTLNPEMAQDRARLQRLLRC